MRIYLAISLFFLLALLTTLTGCANPLAGDSSGFLPENDEYPQLVTTTNRQSASTDSAKTKYLGSDRAALFDQYGLNTIYYRDYTLNSEPLSIESYQISSNIGAVGIFYYYVGQQLRGSGEETEVGGAQAVLDTARGGRNLYFYKGHWLFALIYGGKDPVPDLKPLARYLAELVPGESKRPGGFEFLNVDGISGKYARVTNGNALNFDIFPPGVWALAPDGGRDARICLIDFGDKSRAEKAGSDFHRYLQINATDNGSSAQNFGKTKVSFDHATEKREGKLVYAVYNRYICVASRLDNFIIGETLVGRVVESIRSGVNK